ncbi:hypothetical protein [Jiella avicenniae]|uniref:Uncharacterized protein n=1 Tax=Jiella avicenniae TaxID=2907202 RepID=A0A9X1P2X4_9HYPH|nr:hypothetical protein [Jiella avicenniae]MCE7030405.1 hypothetical protein [Jiella avicenniae]
MLGGRFLDAEGFPDYLVGVDAEAIAPTPVAQVMIWTRSSTSLPLRVRFTLSVTLSGIIHIVVTPNEGKALAKAAAAHPPQQRRLASAHLLLPSMKSFMRSRRRVGKAGVAL